MNEEYLSGQRPRLTGVNLDGITGITFFIDEGSLAGIHVHYPGGSSAMETGQKMSEAMRALCVWNYVPISQDDRVTGIGLKRDLSRPFNILIRTEKSGDIVVGPHSDIFRDKCLVRTAPLMFIYQQFKWNDTLDSAFVSTYSAGNPARNIGEDFPMDRYERCPLSLDSFAGTVCFSWAPLENVTSAVIFRGRPDGVTRGVVLNYLNGGSRALGQCRVGLDLAEEIVLPVGICIKAACGWLPILMEHTNDGECDFHKTWGRKTIYSVRVEFQTGPKHKHPRHQEWSCRPMANMLKFWCSVGNAFCIVRNGTETGNIRAPPPALH